MKIIWFFVLVLLACLFTSCNTCKQSEQSDSCGPPITNFDIKDLFGEWKTGISSDNDTLILKEDGTYKQIIHVESSSSNFDYESSWLPWSMSISDQGIPYLHLDGMRLCVYWEGMDCQITGEGKSYWYDFCKKEWLQTPGEGVLLVLGPPKGIKLPPPGISLFALGKSTDGVTVYELQK